MDGDTISGRDETGWATSGDQDAPGRLASFQAGRDGGVTWKQLTIHLSGKPDRLSMAGVLNATTLVYGSGEGIHRSADAGGTWAKVSPVNPQTRIPVLFRGVHYLGSTHGLLASKDLGATWQPQGAAVNVWQGPFFGRDEKPMLVVGKDGAFLTKTAGADWKQVASLKPKGGGFVSTPNWFGCHAWDPVNHILYASVTGKSRLQIGSLNAPAASECVGDGKDGELPRSPQAV